jgi:hypothetical protein
MPSSTGTFGLRFNPTTGVTTAGKFTHEGLHYLGRLSGEQDIAWTNSVLTPGTYHMYTNGNDMFIFADQ